MIETIGWLGGALLALCAVPQTYKSYVDGHSDGLSWGMLLMWYFGEVASLVYVVPKGHAPLIVNYVINVILITIMIRYKLWPRSST